MRGGLISCGEAAVLEQKACELLCSAPEESPQLAANSLFPTRSRTVAVLPSLGNETPSAPAPPAPPVPPVLFARAVFSLCLCRPSVFVVAAAAAAAEAVQ